MHLHVQDRLVRTELGIVADYCTLCHEIRPCALNRVTTTVNVNGIDLGKGDFVENEIRCSVCRLVRPGFPELFENVGRSQAKNLEMLIERTQPQLRTRRAEQLALDERMRTLSREERRAVLLEELTVADGLVAARAAVRHLDFWSGLGAFMIVGGPILVGVVGELMEVPRDISLVFIVVTALLALGLLLAGVATDVRRFTRRAVVPHMARALVPLGLDSEDMEATLARCSDLKIGRALRAQDLAAALLWAERAGPEPPWKGL